MRSINQESWGGMGGAWMICGFGVGWDGCLSDAELGHGGMRQYVPPKCMVFRLRSVRQTQGG